MADTFFQKKLEESTYLARYFEERPDNGEEQLFKPIPQYLVEPFVSNVIEDVDFFWSNELSGGLSQPATKTKTGMR